MAVHANQFYPFATQPGANVMPNAAYQSLTARSTGYVAGLAASQQLNTTWRQSSFVAAMIAQFTADFGPGDVIDDGVIANLEAQFEAALANYLQGRNIFVPVVPTINWYVDAVNGSDAPGQGLAAGTQAFASIRYCIQTVRTYFSAQIVNVHVAPGTYQGFNIGASLISVWYFQGSGASSCNVVAVAADVSQGIGCTFANGAVGLLTGFNFTGAFGGVVCHNGSTLSLMSNSFGACGGNGCITSARGSITTLEGFAFGQQAVVQVTGSSSVFFNVYSGAWLSVGYTDPGGLGSQTAAITFAGASFSVATAGVSSSGTLLIYPPDVTMAGTPAGPRFSLSDGTITVYGSGLNYIPGSTAGNFYPANTLTGGLSTTTAAGLYA